MMVEEWLQTLPLRLRALFRSRQLDEELKEELQDHLDQQIAENIAKGMSPEDARCAASRSLGGVAQIEQQCRDARGRSVVDESVQDLRYGFRQLRRSPGFSALSILCLTLAIGANAAVFSWVEGILFRPYPAVAHQERLLALAGNAPGESGATEISWPDFVDLRRACTLCDELFVSKITGTTLSVGDHAELATGSIVSANYFDAIGVRPILGRGFEQGEDVGSNAHPVVVISYQLWRNRFNSDPLIIGKTQRLNNVPHTIVGVAPPEFRGTFVGWAMQFWVPVSMEETFEAGGYKLEDRGARWAEAYVLPKAGVTDAQAQQEVSAIASQLEMTYPATNRGRSLKLWPLWATPFNHAADLLPMLEIMLVVVAFVLLIACANVGNLLLLRSLSRRHEMTVRLAIGATRMRLLKQLLTESLILAALGTAGGLGLAYACRHALGLMWPARSGVSMYLPGEIDWRVITLSASICLLVTLIVGLVPVLQSRQFDLSGALKAESPAVTGARGKAPLRSVLVIVQVCLSFILLAGGTLLLKSLHGLRNASPGFSTRSVVQTRVSLVSAGYDVPRAKAFQNELINRINASPGVQSAAFARVMALGYGSYSSTPLAIDGYEVRPEDQPTVEYNQVSPGFLATMGIPLAEGRDFTGSDDENAPLAAIVNRTMVARYWGGQSPIGKRLQVNGRWARVVGVAADSKYESVRESAKPFFYVPLRQDFAREPMLYIRTTGPTDDIATALRRAVHDLDPNLALYEMITLQEQVNRSTSSQLVAVVLVSILGGVALLLAGVGMYGVMSYVVAQNTRELGLRMALGADAANLVRMVLSRGLRLTIAGVLLGTIAGLALTRLMGSVLYQVSPHDPSAFGLALVVMATTAIAACVLPAWRAARTDPAKVLRD